MKKLLGVGVLNWSREERISNRYGSLHLNPSPESHDFVDLERLKGSGTLSLKIIQTRQSPHIGDLFRGIKPGGAVKGESLTLGKGTLFYEEGAVGVKPKTKKQEDWMNPHQLYKAHYQSVELYFTPETKKTVKKKTSTKKKK